MIQPTASGPQAVTTRPKITIPTRVDRILVSLGCDPAFINDLLGDLGEEYLHRAACDGHFVARVWYVREILRSTPHLAWSAVRDGTPGSRARLAACLLAGIATMSIVTIAWVTRNGPPARLVNEAASAGGIVVNYVGPMRFSMVVLDASGHRLERSDVRYEWRSGIPMSVSHRGVAKCTKRGEAVVRATLGALKADFIVHCQPVKKIRSIGWGNFLVGDPPRTLGVDAIGLDGEPVTRIAAWIRVADSTVATLDGTQLRPLKAGFTSVEMEIGNQKVGASVTVFDLLRSLEELRPDQRWVAVPVHLDRGESIRWPLPIDDFFLAFSTDTSAVPLTRTFAASLSAHPGVRLSVDGPIMCMPEPASGVTETHCLAHGPGATLTIRNSGRGARDVVGILALERLEQP
jgi:hypothetical protein